MMPAPSFSPARRAMVLLAAAAGLLGLGWWWFGRYLTRHNEYGLEYQRMMAPLHPLPQAGPRAAFDSTRLRGVNWVGGDSVTLAELQPLRAAGVTWLAQTPFGWQNSVDEPVVHMRTSVGRGRYRDW